MSIARQMAAVSLLWFALTPVGWVVLAPWVGWSLLLTGALYAVLTFVVCRSVRRDQREMRRRVRKRARLWRDLYGSNVVRLWEPESVESLVACWETRVEHEMPRQVQERAGMTLAPLRVVPSQWSIAGPFDPKDVS